MQLTINEHDIVFAVTKFIKEQGFNGSVEKIDFTMGRNGNGLTASINLNCSYSSGSSFTVGSRVSPAIIPTNDAVQIVPFSTEEEPKKESSEEVKQEDTPKSVKSIFSTMRNPVN